MPPYYMTTLKPAFLTNDGDISITDMGCYCPEHNWAKTKGFRTSVECVHIAAMEQEFYDRISGIREKPFTNKDGTSDMPFSPFSFSSNCKSRDNRLEYKNPNLAALEYDVLVHRYILDNGFYEINKKLLQLLEIYSLPLLEGIRNGDMFYEVLKHSFRLKEITKTEQKYLKRFNREIGEILRSSGYMFNGYCLEFDSPAVRYETGTHAVGLFFSDDLMLYVVREKRKDIANPFAGHTETAEPFNQLYDTRKMLDDRTKTITPASVRIPTRISLPGRKPVHIYMPDYIRQRYKKRIIDNSQHPSRDMKTAGL